MSSLAMSSHGSEVFADADRHMKQSSKGITTRHMAYTVRNSYSSAKANAGASCQQPTSEGIVVV